ncbi:hypothetical protein DFH09DRAFT_1466252 [Mycena vulgaris]|nr:hypothetical protein DFH09DRAFT_1466252 [Mycena vulgaris]
MALALVCVLVLIPVIHALFPRSSSRTPPYDTVLFLYARPTACTPFSTVLYSPDAFPAHNIVLPLTSPSPIRFLPVPCHPCHPFFSTLPPPSRFFSAPSVLPIPPPPAPAPVSPLRHPSSPPSPSFLSASSSLLIPAPRLSPFFPYSVLPCFLPVQSPHPPSVPAPLLPRPHPSASPSISLSYLTALPLLLPLPPSPFPLPALPSASSPSSPPHLRPHPHPPLSISSVYPRKR